MPMPKLNKRSKILAISIFLLFSTPRLFSLDFTLHLYPSYMLPFNKLFNNTGAFNVNAGLDVSPVVIRERDKPYFSTQFEYSGFYVKGFGIQSILDFGLGLGYDCRINDRFGVFAEFNAGLWSYTGANSLTQKTASGLSFGGRLGGSFYVASPLSVTAFAGFKSLYSKPEPFMNALEFGIGIKYSLSRGIFSSNNIEIADSHIEKLFPVFYNYYSDNPFAYLELKNNEENDISDVNVEVFIESYMTSPFTVYSVPVVKREQSFEVSVCALLDSNILALVQPKSCDLELILTYNSLGQKKTSNYNLSVTALSRNSMTWEDDRRAAAFVSGKDATAQRFAKQVKAAVKNQLRTDIPLNIQYAAALFGALKAFGINYVVDPSSAFTDNIGTASVDFLQFPYQTLVYHGGDCDDLTILNCSLLEALDVDTAFITVPGHIFMAFDSGLDPKKEKSKPGSSYYIYANDRLWIPLEITLSQDSFGLAWSYGAREWKKYEKDAILIPLKEAWKVYKPISVPGSDTAIEIPSQDAIIKLFKSASYY